MRNAVSGYLYSGINVMLLGLTMDACGFTDPRWITYQQARNLGGQVRGGERGTLVIFWKPFTVRGADDERELDVRERTIPFLRHYTVFNVAQCENLKLPAVEVKPLPPVVRNEACDAFASSTGAVIRTGGGVAAYPLRVTTDYSVSRHACDKHVNSWPGSHKHSGRRVRGSSAGTTR